MNFELLLPLFLGVQDTFSTYLPVHFLHIFLALLSTFVCVHSPHHGTPLNPWNGSLPAPS